MSQCDGCKNNLGDVCFNANTDVLGKCSNRELNNDIAKLKEENIQLRCSLEAKAFEVHAWRKQHEDNMSRLSSAYAYLTSMLIEPITINGVVYEHKMLDKPFTIRDFQRHLAIVRDKLVPR